DLRPRLRGDDAGVRLQQRRDAGFGDRGVVVRRGDPQPGGAAPRRVVRTTQEGTAEGAVRPAGAGRRRLDLLVLVARRAPEPVGASLDPTRPAGAARM
ncbi:MAG: hypothetical protein AVDCRST_MAG51-1474, partial [uncultured Ramlibacter sp.]